jgi:acetoin utilization deacetylase AcuC-like enzyme
MTTLFLTHPSSLNHLTPAGHPERPDRIRALEKVMAHDNFKPLAREEAPMASIETAALCHPMEYVEMIRENAPKEGMVGLDGDTVMSPGSFEAVMRCIGAATHAVDEVMEKRVTNAFIGMRPPGHHAETAKPMGFCIFNSAAIAARYAQKQHGLERVALIDFDVHHGNGSQDIFWRDPSVMYCSTHQMPLYPGTGGKDERGEHNNIVNAPLRSGDGGEQFREAVETVILPRLREFQPDFVLISAGFDAHHRDPLANLELTESDFAWVTLQLMELADKFAGGRIVSLLEGGYDLQGLAGSAAAHVNALMRA